MPKVSVIMPLYNAEKYVEKAIYSILKQTYSDFELILIDDQGSDKTIEIARSILDERIVYICNEKNLGIAKSRNRGIYKAKGEYIALMDDDDIAPLDRLEKEVNFLDCHPEYDVVGGRMGVIDANDTIVKLYNEPLMNPNYIRASLMFFDPIANGSTLIRKRFIQKNELSYQDNCFGMEDYRFWIDCSVCGNITNIRDVMLYWRDTGTNESTRMRIDENEQRIQYYSELEKYAIAKNGFILTDKELELYVNMFPEIMTDKSIKQEDLKKLYGVLRKIVKQSEEMNLGCKEEIRIACKKNFSRRLENSAIW